ncbi:fasciclin domain-containing protein [Parapedobacter soli]|uniref:fasciclin domain-containing protein n=1 Tax=Parapedobacter soli TaxID=416955 RepID=UPI0021C788E0|nr:fasciclin domain-containing protein [Parapedobacter soli]
MKWLSLISMLAVYITVSGQQIDKPTNATVGGTVMDSQQDIMQNISKTRDHTVFSAVIKAAGLDQLLRDDGPFTVFAATSDAFIHKMPAGTVEVMFDELLPEQQPALYDIMSYNIIKGNLGQRDIRRLVKSGNGKAVLTTLSGKLVVAEVTQNDELILKDENNRVSRIRGEDIIVKNGTILVTDEVLLPHHPFFHETLTLYPSGKKLHEVIKPNHAYHQTLTLTLGMSFATYDGNSRTRDNGGSQIRYTVQEAFDFIQQLDKLTLGIPKIIFLVGWQYRGHDSKYPAFFEGNDELKRPQDKDALESLRWLMAEAKKFNTTVSLHINFTDAYEDSPLWEEYLANDIIGRLEGGHIRKAVGWGYPISYVQELKTGYFKKRVDRLFELLPLKDAGVVHVDAFHTYSPLDPRGPMSPYLGYTVEQEEEAQKEMFAYVASKGANVTSEFVHEFRDFGFQGYQHFAWHFRITAQEYLDWPASYYCGGLDKTELGRLFGTSFHLNMGNIKANFCTKTLPWYFLNRLERLAYQKNSDFQTAIFSEGVESRLDKAGNYSLTQDGRALMINGDVFVPAQWINSQAIIAYSTAGYTSKTWELPDEWKGVKKAAIYQVDFEGKKRIASIDILNNKVTLQVAEDQQLLLLPEDNDS